MKGRAWLVGGIAIAALAGGVAWTEQAQADRDAACDVTQLQELDRLQAVVRPLLPAATDLRGMNQCRFGGDAQVVAVTPLGFSGGEVDRLFESAGWTPGVQPGDWNSADGQTYVTRGWDGRGTDFSKRAIEISVQRVGYRRPAED